MTKEEFEAKKANLEAKRKEKMKELLPLLAQYKNKFGVDYTHCMIRKMSFDEEIAELKDCIENNHLQSTDLPEDYDPRLEY